MKICMLDMAFEPIEELVPLVEINTTAAREQVTEAKIYIRLAKDKIRATMSEFPFKYIPEMLLLYTVYFCVFGRISFERKKSFCFHESALE